MKKKIVKVEEVSDNKRSSFDKAKKIGKAILKVTAGIVELYMDIFF